MMWCICHCKDTNFSAKNKDKKENLRTAKPFANYFGYKTNLLPLAPCSLPLKKFREMPHLPIVNSLFNVNSTNSDQG